MYICETTVLDTTQPAHMVEPLSTVVDVTEFETKQQAKMHLVKTTQRIFRELIKGYMDGRIECLPSYDIEVRSDLTRRVLLNHTAITVQMVECHPVATETGE